MEPQNIHLITLGLTILVILYSDHLAFQYFRGKRALLDGKSIRRIHYLVWSGLIGMIVSGIFLFIPMWEYLLGSPVFYIKMAFVLVLVINACVIGQISHVSSTRPFSELTDKEKRHLLTSGTVSFVCWIGAMTIGLFFL